MNAVAAAMLDRAVLSRAEHRAREAIGSDGAVLAALLEGLAGAYWGLGDRARALELQQDIMAIRMGALGPAHRDTIRTQSKVALWHWVMGRYAESTPHAEEVYARALEHLPPHDPDRLAATHVMGLAGAAHGTAAREALLLRALDGQEHVLGPGHPDTIWSMLGLVNLYHGQGRSDDAGPIVRDAVDRSVRMLGRDEEVTLYAQRYLRRQLEREGDLNGAIALVREIVSTRDRVFGPTHPGSITELRALARLLGARGDLVEARRVAEQHVARNRQAFGDTHPETRDARAFLARLQVETAGAAASPDDVPAPSAALPSPHSGSTPAP